MNYQIAVQVDSGWKVLTGNLFLEEAIELYENLKKHLPGKYKICQEQEKMNEG